MQITDKNRKWWVLSAMGGILGIVVLDETVVGVALPSIQGELRLSQVTAHWVINAYLLVFAGFAAVGGKLGDLFGRYPIFLIGIAMFGAASIACGFAENGAWLITARAVQGLGAAIVFPITVAIITAVFPPEQRGMALGIYSAIGTFFLALGPLVGGGLTELLSWHWIFWINPLVIFCIVAIMFIAWREPVRTDQSHRIDYWGALALVGGLGMFVFAVMQGPEWGWSRPVIGILLVCGLLMLAVFTVIERRIAKPLIDVGLFNGQTFSVCNLILFTAQFNQMAIVVFGALYLQRVLGMSPFVAGLALLVAVGAAPISAAPTGRLVDRYGARPLALGALVMTIVGLLWIGLAVDLESYPLLVPAFIAWGAANCALYIAPRRAVVNAVPESKHGETGGILMTSQLLGGTISVAICGTLYAITNNFRIVFLTAAALSLVVLLLTWRSMERPGAVVEVPAQP